jgi:hypothetical protein
MNYRLAARAMIRIFVLEPFTPLQSDTGHTTGHLHWMLRQIIETEMSEGKANRWLGWAQCLCVWMGYAKLDRLKELNRACSCDDEGCPEYDTLHIHTELAKPLLENKAVRRLLETAKSAAKPSTHAVLLGGPEHEHTVVIAEGLDAIETARGEWIHTYESTLAIWPGEAKARVYVFKGSRPNAGARLIGNKAIDGEPPTVDFWRRATQAAAEFVHCPGVVIHSLNAGDVKDGFLAGVRWAKGNVQS